MPYGNGQTIARFYVGPAIPSPSWPRRPAAADLRATEAGDGVRLHLPLALRDTEWVEFADRELGLIDERVSVARFCIGGDGGYLVRLTWDPGKDGCRLSLPTAPGAWPFIIWEV